MANEPNSIGPIPQFLQKVSSSWDLSFIFTKIWAVSFAPKRTKTGTLLGDINLAFSTCNEDINKFTGFMNTAKGNRYADLLHVKENDPNTINVGGAKHFILANKVTIPEESVSINTNAYPNQENAGGIIWPRIGGGRFNASNRALNITFLDTNKEFIDYIIKPWIIAIANQGLIEDASLPCLKCDIYAHFFAKSSPSAKTTKNGDKLSVLSNYPKYNNIQSLNTEPYTWMTKETDIQVSSFNENRPYLRKTIIFKNCFPMSIPSKGYNYASDMGNDETMTDVKFSYDYYEMQDNTGGFTDSLSNLSPIVNEQA